MAFTKITLSGAIDTIKQFATKLNDLIDDLLSTSSGKGASQIGLEDSAGNFDADNVEDFATEVYSDHASTRTLADVFNEDSSTTTGLTWGYQAGAIRVDNVVTDITASTIALTDDDTNYIEISQVGVVSRNTTAFTVGRIPIRQIVTSSGVQTISTDKRAWFIQVAAATTSIVGTVELSTDAEFIIGADTNRVTTPANVKLLSTKGGDLTSANPLVIDTDGMYFDVAGTTNFASMTVAANRLFVLQFDGILTMTHHATNLDLPGEANIKAAAGDVGIFLSTGTNTVQCINYTRAYGASVAGIMGASFFPDYNEANQGVAGSGKSANAYIDIINTDSATLVFRHNSGSATTTYTFSTNETIPSNINVIIEKGALLSIDNGIILTIENMQSPGRYQVFSGTGVIVGALLIDHLKPEWFPSLQAAFNCTSTTGIKLEFTDPNATWNFDTQHTIGSNSHIVFKGTMSTTETGASLPVSFLAVSGSDIIIDGFKMTLGSGPFIVPSNKGSWILLDDITNLTIQNCDVRNVFYGIDVTATANNYTALNNVVIKDNILSAVRTEIHLNGITGSNLTIKDNTFTGDKDWTSPNQSQGEIWIFGSHVRNTDTDFDDTDYVASYKNVRILDNIIDFTDHRTFEFGNMVDFIVEGNIINGNTGTYATAGVSADVITLDLCRDGKLIGNTVNASGENGLDILSCMRIIATDNIFRQIDTVGVILSISDISADGDAASLSAHYLVNQDIKINNNYIAASAIKLQVRLGTSLDLKNNYFGDYWNGRTDKASLLDFSLDGTGTEATNNIPSDIDLSGTQKQRIGKTVLTSDFSGNICRTAVAHRLTTGDRIELYVLDNGAGDTIPTALSTYTDYYAIKVNTTDFKLATSIANAVAGTNITFADNEVGTVFVEEVEAGNNQFADAWEITERIILSKSIAQVSPLTAPSGAANYVVNTQYAWTTGADWALETVEYWFLIQAPNTTYGAVAGFIPRYYRNEVWWDEADTETRGFKTLWRNKTQLIYTTLNKLVGVPAFSGNGQAIHDVSTGYCRIVMY